MITRASLILILLVGLVAGCDGAGRSGCNVDRPGWVAAARVAVTERGGILPTPAIIGQWEVLIEANLSPERDGSAADRERDARGAMRRALAAWGIADEARRTAASVEIVDAYQRELCAGTE